MDKIIEAKKQRYLKFYNSDPSVKRLYHIHVGSDSAVNPSPVPLLWRDNVQQRVDWAAKQYELDMARLSWLADDLIPYGCCVTGTEIFPEAFGCEVRKPQNDWPFAVPLITEASQVKNLKVPKLEDSSLACLFDMADKIKQKCGEGALLSLVDPQTPMDIAALIWDKNYFYAAMIEAPDAVKELSGMACALFFDFFDEWFRRYGKEFIAHYPDYYMPYGVDFSEDEVGAVSPEFFEEFFLPELVKISGRYGQCAMHCCASSRHQWENFKKIPNLKMINFLHPNDAKLVTDSTAFFAGHSALFPYWQGDGEPETWLWQLCGDAWVCMDFVVKDDEEAKRLSEKLERIR